MHASTCLLDSTVHNCRHKFLCCERFEVSSSSASSSTDEAYISLIFLQSCKHESWISTAKYLVDDVPCLLKSEAVKNIKDVLSVVLSSLPNNFREFIKWVAEVRRQEEDGGLSLSQEEKGRLAIKVFITYRTKPFLLFVSLVSFCSLLHYMLKF